MRAAVVVACTAIGSGNNLLIALGSTIAVGLVGRSCENALQASLVEVLLVVKTTNGFSLHWRACLHVVWQGDPAKDSHVEGAAVS